MRRALPWLARGGIVVLLLIGLFYALWFFQKGLFLNSDYDERLQKLVGESAFYALFGSLVAGTLLLVARFRPEDRRGRWRVAALVVVVLAALGGPARLTARYAWMVSADPRFDAALSELHLPEGYTPVQEPPGLLVVEAPDGPYAWRAWHVPAGTEACGDLRRSLRAWLAAPVEPATPQETPEPARCLFYSSVDVGYVYASVVDYEPGSAPTYTRPIVYAQVSV